MSRFSVADLMIGGGFFMLIYGLAQFSIPLALVITGALFIAAGILREAL